MVIRDLLKQKRINNNQQTDQVLDLDKLTSSFLKLIQNIYEKKKDPNLSKTEIRQDIDRLFKLYKNILSHFKGKPLSALDKHFQDFIYRELFEYLKSTNQDLIRNLLENDFSISLTSAEQRIRSLDEISLMIAKRVRLYSMAILFSEGIEEEIKLSIASILIDDITSAYISFKNFVHDLSEISIAQQDSTKKFSLFLKICDSAYFQQYLEYQSNSKIAELLHEIRKAKQSNPSLNSFEDIRSFLSNSGKEDLVKYLDIFEKYFAKVTTYVGKYLIVENSNIFSDVFIVLNYPREGLFKYIATGLINVDERIEEFSKLLSNFSKFDQLMLELITLIPDSSMFSTSLYLGQYNPTMLINYRADLSFLDDSKTMLVLKKLESLSLAVTKIAEAKLSEFDTEAVDTSLRSQIKSTLSQIDKEIYRDYYFLVSTIIKSVNPDMPLVNASVLALKALESYVYKDLNRVLGSLSSKIDSTLASDIIRHLSLRSRPKEDVLRLIYLSDRDYPTIMLPLSLNKETRVFDLFYGTVDLSVLSDKFDNRDFVDNITNHFMQFISKANINLITTKFTIARTSGHSIEIAPFSYLYPSREINLLQLIHSLYHEGAHISFDTFSVSIPDNRHMLQWQTPFEVTDSDGYHIREHMNVVIDFMNKVISQTNDKLKAKSSNVSLREYYETISKIAVDELISLYPDLKEAIEQSEESSIISLKAEDNSIKSTLITLVSLLLNTEILFRVDNIAEDCRIDTLLRYKPLHLPRYGIYISLDEELAAFYQILNNLLISYYSFYRTDKDFSLRVDNVTHLDLGFMLSAFLGALKLDTELFIHNFSFQIHSDKLSESQKAQLTKDILSAIQEIKEDILASDAIESRYHSVMAALKFIALLSVLRRYNLTLVIGNSERTPDEPEDGPKLKTTKKDEKGQSKTEGQERVSSLSTYSINVSRELVKEYKEYFLKLRVGEIVTQRFRSKDRGRLDIRKAAENFAAGANVSSMFIRKKSLIDLDLGESILQKPLVIYLAIDSSGSMGTVREHIKQDMDNMSPIELSLIHVTAMIIGYLEALKENSIESINRKVILKLLSVSDQTFAEIEINPVTFKYTISGSEYSVELPFSVIGYGTDLSAMIKSCKEVIEETNQRINSEFISKIETSTYQDAVKPDYLFLFFTDFGNTAGTIEDIIKVLDELKSFAEKNCTATKSDLSSGSKLAVMFVAPLTASTALDTQIMDQLSKKIVTSELNPSEFDKFIRSLNVIIEHFSGENSSSSNIQ